jgi:hypothetical protein
VAFSAGGCGPEDMQWQYRQFHTPDDFDKMPLGPMADTRDKVARIHDPALRGHMAQWMDLRDEYLKAWKSQGDYGPDVKKIKELRSTLFAVIQDQAMQLRGAGQPLMN